MLFRIKPFIESFMNESLIHYSTDLFKNTESLTNKTQRCGFICSYFRLFAGEQNRRNNWQLCIKCKFLNINLLFIELTHSRSTLILITYHLSCRCVLITEALTHLLNQQRQIPNPWHKKEVLVVGLPAPATSVTLMLFLFYSENKKIEIEDITC